MNARSILDRLLLLFWVVLTGLVSAGCGLPVERGAVRFHFDYPLLNESWGLRYLTEPGKAVAEKGPRTKADGDGPTEVVKRLPPPPQLLRGGDESVTRAEVVLSARRLLGLRDSFTQDSWLRHLLVVNNLAPPDTAEEGALQTWYTLGRKPGHGQILAGDILFLGKDEAEWAVVVEEVWTDGTVVFIGVLGEEVSRGVLSLTSPKVRRDESSGKVLNTYLRGNLVAGEGLLAVVSPAGPSGEGGLENPSSSDSLVRGQ